MGLLRPLLPIPQSRRLQGLEGPWAGVFKEPLLAGPMAEPTGPPSSLSQGWEGGVGVARLRLLEMVGA